MQRSMRKVLVGLGSGLIAAILCSCSQNKASPKADASELERAFALTAGAIPTDEPTTAALAVKAVAAIRAQDWPKAVPILTQLRTTRGLTAQQLEAVHNANGNAYVRLVEMAKKGSEDAEATLRMLSKSAAVR
jgi:hypothetical protein